MAEAMIQIRPPSEGNSLLLPVTFGCSNNTCIFCGTYKNIKFRIRNAEDIKKDIDTVAANYSFSVKRIFLENGDALIAPQPLLVETLEHMNKSFPNMERAGTYASPKSVLLKSVEELRQLNELGLTIAYLGVETGDPELLLKVKKGVNYDQMVEAGRKLKEAGITTSVTVILGLGGTELSERHALNTARILTDIDPDFAGALVLGLGSDTELHQEYEESRFTTITPFQTLQELKTMIEYSDFTDCFFTSNHASNYLAIKVQLPRQKKAAVEFINDIIEKQDKTKLRPDFLREY